MDFSPPGQGPFVHGISQARILEWIAISFSRGSSQHKDQTCVTYIAAIWKAPFDVFFLLFSYQVKSNPVDCSMPGSPILRCLSAFAQIHVH